MSKNIKDIGGGGGRFTFDVLLGVDVEAVADGGRGAGQAGRGAGGGAGRGAAAAGHRAAGRAERRREDRVGRGHGQALGRGAAKVGIEEGRVGAAGQRRGHVRQRHQVLRLLQQPVRGRRRRPRRPQRPALRQRVVGQQRVRHLRTQKKNKPKWHQKKQQRINEPTNRRH